MSIKQNSRNIVNDAIIKDIAVAVGSLEYGTVTIKVHETKIIQIGEWKEVVGSRHLY